jgi:hypothetical protein
MFHYELSRSDMDIFYMCTHNFKTVRNLVYREVLRA